MSRFCLRMLCLSDSLLLPVRQLPISSSATSLRAAPASRSVEDMGSTTGKVGTSMPESQPPAIDEVAYAALEEIADGDNEFMTELLKQYLLDARRLARSPPLKETPPPTARSPAWHAAVVLAVSPLATPVTVPRRATTFVAPAAPGEPCMP